jgi:hypothetical protein
VAPQRGKGWAPGCDHSTLLDRQAVIVDSGHRHAIHKPRSEVRKLNPKRVVRGYLLYIYDVCQWFGGPNCHA